MREVMGDPKDGEGKENKWNLLQLKVFVHKNLLCCIYSLISFEEDTEGGFALDWSFEDLAREPVPRATSSNRKTYQERHLKRVAYWNSVLPDMETALRFRELACTCSSPTLLRLHVVKLAGMYTLCVNTKPKSEGPSYRNNCVRRGNLQVNHNSSRTGLARPLSISKLL